VFDEELAQREEDVGALESEELRQPSAAPRAIVIDVVDEFRVGDGESTSPVAGLKTSRSPAPSTRYR